MGGLIIWRQKMFGCWWKWTNQTLHTIDFAAFSFWDYERGQKTIFPLSHARDKTKNIFVYFFTELKTQHLSHFIYKHEAIDIANPSSMLKNFVIDRAHRRVSVAQW